MRKTQRLLALLLVLALLVPCFGAALAEDGDGKKTPAPVEAVYSIDGVNYYNTYKDNPTQAETDFELPEKLLPAMLKANVLDSKGDPIGCNYYLADDHRYLDYNYSIADLWMLLGLRANKYSQIHTNKVEISPDAIDTAMFNALHFKNTRQDVSAGYIGKCSDATYGDSFFSVVNQICATMVDGSDGMAGIIPSNLANEIKEKVIKSDADWYNNQDVIGMMNFARYNDQAYGGVLLFFTDFQAVPLLPDSKKPDSYVTIIEKKEPSSKKYASNVKNLTAAAVTASQTVSESWSTTLSSEVSGSEQYSLSTTVSIGETLDLLVAQASINLSLTMGEVIEKGWKESKSTTASESVERTVSVALPPYTNVLLEEGSTETSAITTYNCPVGMKFKVWMYIWEHDGNDFRRAYALFGPDARADLYRRAIRLGTDEYPDGDKMKIQWGENKGKSSLQKRLYGVCGHQCSCLAKGRDLHRKPEDRFHQCQGYRANIAASRCEAGSAERFLHQRPAGFLWELQLPACGHEGGGFLLYHPVEAERAEQARRGLLRLQSPLGRVEGGGRAWRRNQRR